MTRTRILLADDHEVVLEGLRRILDLPEFEVVGVVENGRALVDAASDLHPDVLVVDISMPVLGGIEAVRRIRESDQSARVVFLSMHSETAYAVEAIHAGGSAYIRKDTAVKDLVAAIREIRQGKIFVSPSMAGRVMRALGSE
jgi:DNA-binding NarL/FixJ family response regulator